MSTAAVSIVALLSCFLYIFCISSLSHPFPSISDSFHLPPLRHSPSGIAAHLDPFDNFQQAKTRELLSFKACLCTNSAASQRTQPPSALLSLDFQSELEQARHFIPTVRAGRGSFRTTLIESGFFSLASNYIYDSSAGSYSYPQRACNTVHSSLALTLTPSSSAHSQVP